jgi:hypothetical protein
MDRLDQFFTNDNVVDKCLLSLDLLAYDIIVEPSAGSGSFYFKIEHKNKIAYDIEPKFSETICYDFLETEPLLDRGEILVVGNPPFGKNSSLAVKFFNHASSFADTIAFILPRTFRKPSIKNRLGEYFHLVEETILSKNSFHTPDGKLYDVPCVWQVWHKTDKEREKIIVRMEHKDFMFVERKEADFLIQRVGGGAGIVTKNMNKKEPAYYNIKASEEVYNVFKKIDWDKSAKYDTAGNPSLSKGDIIEMYERFV